MCKKSWCRRLGLLLAVILCFSLTIQASAHSGRTDSQGGHRDNKNVSGLGYYHYHCGGNPPHLHTNGICPYSSAGSSTAANTSTGTNKTSTGTNKTSTSTSSKASLKLSQTSLTLLKGKSKTLKVSGTSDKVKWSTSDKKIATVSQSGKVTAVAKGSVTITAKAGSLKKTCKVKVEAPKLSKSKLTLKPGEEFTLKVSGTKQDVVWSSNSDAVWIDDEGCVYAYDIGTATITAKVGTSKTGVVKLKCKVTVATPKAKELILSSSEVQIAVGESAKLNATVSPAEVTDYEDMEWSSSDEGIARIFTNGTVYAVAPGKVTITVQIGGKSAECAVTVTEAAEKN